MLYKPEIGLRLFFQKITNFLPIRKYHWIKKYHSSNNDAFIYLLTIVDYNITLKDKQEQKLLTYNGQC